MDNKIKYNIKNAHYAKLKTSDGGKIEYEKPVAWPGSVSINLAAQGEISKFYADGIVYYQTAANNGYEGDFESAYVPDDFRVDILGETLDSKNVMVENADGKPSPFALLFEFDGDQKAVRHVLYNCTATRPSIESETKEESVDPVTESLTLSATPLPNGNIKAKTTIETDSDAYQNWYEKVYIPDDGE